MGRNYKKADLHWVKERISEQMCKNGRGFGWAPELIAEVVTQKIQSKLTTMLTWGKGWAE